MQYIRFYRGEGVVWGRVEGERVKALTGAPYLDGAETGEVFPLSELTLAAPCEPTKIVAIGKNYYDHAVEMGEGVPETPALFFKTTNCICDPEAEIPYPAHLTERLDYEGEIAVVIGKKASRLTKENAMDAVFGYTILNDVTARDVQKREIQWTRGKAIDNGAGGTVDRDRNRRFRPADHNQAQRRSAPGLADVETDARLCGAARLHH